MKFKKVILGLGLALVLSGCGGGQVEETSEEVVELIETESQVSEERIESQEAESGERDLVDDLGRTLVIPQDLSRLASSGNMASMILYSIDPDLIVARAESVDEDSLKYFTEDFVKLPDVGAFYGKKANLNIEALLATEPQVVIDIGEVKGNPEEMARELDELQEKIGLPVVFVEADIWTMDKAYEKMGQILGQEERCQVLADYVGHVVREAEAKAGSIKEEDKKRVFVGEFESGLATMARGSFQSEILDLVGAINVVEADIDTKNDVSIEQVLAWNPDLVIFGPRSIYDSVAEDETWQALGAISRDEYYEVPYGPYNWMGRPPAVNRVLGIMWLGNLIYPEVYDYDMLAKAQEFYKLFYQYELSEEEARELMGNSTFKMEKK